MKRFLLSNLLMLLLATTATAATTPEKVVGVTVKERTITAITLKWEAQEAADKYQVRVENAKGELVKKVGTTKVKLEITDLKAEKEYTFKVRAKINDTFGKYSKAVTAKTKAEPVAEIEEEQEVEEEQEENTEEATAQTHTVDISGFAFSDATITVSVGDTVRWTNQDSSGHTVTEVQGSFNSGTMSQGEVFEHTFTSAGSFSYFCAIHPSMTGTVIVQ